MNIFSGLTGNRFLNVNKGNKMLNMTPEQIAEIANNVNNAYCKALNDNSTYEWKDAPENIKMSSIAGVKFHGENQDVTPKMTHQAWLDFKVADGWVYGPVKNAEKKEHPCLVEYEKLPLEQQVKDYLFKAIVETCIKL